MGNATTYRCPDGGRPDTGSAARGRLHITHLGLAALALTFGSLLVGADAFAQSKKAANAKAESAQADQAAAQRAYAAGTKSFESGDMNGAEQHLSAALANGGLPSTQMARALYLRGSAYRKLGRPAQAISDLTTAIWLKGGLSDSDKAKATEERQLAYREAGLGDTPPPIGAAPLDQSTKTAASPPPPPSGAQVVHVTQQSFWNNFSMPSLTGSSQPAPPPAAAAQPQAQESSSFWSFLPSMGGGSQPAPAAQQPAAPSVGFAADSASVSTPQGTGTVMLAEAAPVSPTASWDTQTATTTSDAYQPPASSGYGLQAAPQAGLSPMGATGEPAPAASGNPLAGTGTAVSNFFGNVFGSGSSEASAPAATATGSTGTTWNPDTAVVTAQTSSMVQRGPDSLPPQTPSEALPWGGGGGAAQPATAPAAPAPPPVKVAKGAGASGNYKLQVAAVRSRAEAEKLVQTLSGYGPVREGRVLPEIDEAVIGSMGTFYRVRLGPYANATEPNQLCTTLKPQGFDCLVVTQ